MRRGAGRQSVRVVRPMGADRGAGLRRELARGAGGDHHRPVLLFRHLLNSRSDGRNRQVDHRVHPGIGPLPRRRAAISGLFWVSACTDLDGLPKIGGAEIRHRHLRREHRAFATAVRVRPGLVCQDADTNGPSVLLRPRETVAAPVVLRRAARLRRSRRAVRSNWLPSTFPVLIATIIAQVELWPGTRRSRPARRHRGVARAR